MRDRYLEVTFRNGKPLAAYLYLPRQNGVRSVRTEAAAPGILVDYAASGEPIGLELTAPLQTRAEQIDAVLKRLGLGVTGPGELQPLQAA